MKILFMAWSIYDARLKQFSNNYTGGGLAIKNICEYVGRKQEAYLFIGKYKMPGLKLGNIQIIDTLSVEDVEEDRLDEKEKHLQTMTRAFRDIIDKLCPDIVNVHGLGVLAKRCIMICQEKAIPCVYTEHLYIGQQKVIEKYETNIEWEKELYKIPDLQIIAVSSGMKRLILNDFPAIRPENICVIRNGTDFGSEQIESSTINDFGLINKKILLCVGTLLARKNQMQLVRCFSLLAERVSNEIRIIFCGKDGMERKIQNAIKDAGLENELIYVGALSSEDMKKYYSIADGLIMPSIAEGLSIAALEAIAYGLPVIMFSDSECAEDLNDDKVTCFAEHRTDEDLAKAITKWYETEWDRDYIKEYSKQFTLERVADEYVACYQRNIIVVGENKELI